MAMPNLVPRYTAADLAKMPDDGKRYELIAGELIVSPAPSVHHQIVLGRLCHALGRYLEPMGLRDTLFDVAADISWDEENLVQPDLLVVRPEELSRSWTTVRNLRLAVEVMSPSSSRRDRVDKRRLYQQHQVETYWIVEPGAQLVEQWRPYLIQQLGGLGLEPVPSAANFVLVGFPKTPGKTAKDAEAYLASKGIIVRGVAGYGLPDHLRITIGLEEHNRAVVEALAAFVQS